MAPNCFNSHSILHHHTQAEKKNRCCKSNGEGFIRVTEYKSKIQIPVAFQYSSNGKSKNPKMKLRDNFPQNSVKYLGIHLTKEVYDMY